MSDSECSNPPSPAPSYLELEERLAAAEKRCKDLEKERDAALRQDAVDLEMARHIDAARVTIAVQRDAAEAEVERLRGIVVNASKECDRYVSGRCEELCPTDDGDWCWPCRLRRALAGGGK